MDPHCPIPLYPHPPPTTQGQLSSHEDSELSDFGPIRIRNSTPDPPNTQSVTNRSRYRSSTVRNHSELPSSPGQSPGPRLSRPSHRLPNKPVLGHKNIINTVEVTVQHTDKATKSSSKRHLEPLDSVDNNRRLKRQCLDLQDDLNWMKVEIADIKAYMRDIKMCMREIAEHLRGDVDYKLEEIIDRLRQLELSSTS